MECIIFVCKWQWTHSNCDGMLNSFLPYELPEVLLKLDLLLMGWEASALTANGNRIKKQF